MIQAPTSPSRSRNILEKIKDAVSKGRYLSVVYGKDGKFHVTPVFLSGYKLRWGNPQSQRYTPNYSYFPQIRLAGDPDHVRAYVMANPVGPSQTLEGSLGDVYNIRNYLDEKTIVAYQLPYIQNGELKWLEPSKTTVPALIAWEIEQAKTGGAGRAGAGMTFEQVLGMMQSWNRGLEKPAVPQQSPRQVPARAAPGTAKIKLDLRGKIAASQDVKKPQWLNVTRLDEKGEGARLRGTKAPQHPTLVMFGYPQVYFDPKKGYDGAINFLRFIGTPQQSIMNYINTVASTKSGRGSGAPVGVPVGVPGGVGVTYGGQQSLAQPQALGAISFPPPSSLGQPPTPLVGQSVQVSQQPALPQITQQIPISSQAPLSPFVQPAVGLPQGLTGQVPAPQLALPSLTSPSSPPLQS